MILYFVVSIVNSLAQSYAKKVDETARNLSASKPKPSKLE